MSLLSKLEPPEPEPPAVEALDRWRLILGESSHGCLGAPRGAAAEADAALSWLYDRRDDEPADEDRDLADRRGGSEASQLTVPGWIDHIHRLFPRETIERLEQDAVQRYRIHEVVTNVEVLRRVEPNETLLQAILQTKHLMHPEVLAAARELVAKVVRQLMEKFATEIRRSLTGPRDRRRSHLKSASNLDFATTLRRNLRRWSPAAGKLYLERTYFFSRSRRHVERWQVILLVDQSASMVGSVIHAAITAACFWSLPGMQTHLVAFNTAVVDLTADVTDPVELLLKVQLGGGTDIEKAVAYAESLIEFPRRTIVVLISDFFEGGDGRLLVRRVAGMTAAGVKVLGLAALDAEAKPVYDHELGRRLVEAGAEVGAMTPGQLATFIGDQMSR